MLTKQKVKGVVIDNTFLILNGVVSISDINHYTKEYKDEKGIKRKDRHVFFVINYGLGSLVRIERDRDRLPLNKHRDYGEPNTLVIYSDRTLSDVRSEILNLL